MDSIFKDAAVVLLLVNENREVIDINKTGEIFSGNNRNDVLGLLAGQAISCINATENGNPVCGKGKNCGNCIIRNCVNNTFQKDEDSYKLEGTMNIFHEGEASLYNVLISSSLINYKGERMALVTLDDITKQKSVEKQLEEINAMKDKFFSIMAHDLKNPFNSILGYSELLMDLNVDDDTTKEEQKLFVKYLHNSSKQAYSLLEDLLTWARMQMNRIPFKPENISLNEIVCENIKLHHPAAFKKNIEIVDRVEENVNVLGDRFMVNTVVRNLISNAVKFTKNDGIISVATDKISENNIRVEIADTGVGISKDIIPKLFSIEENYSSNGTNGEKGTGLGLILCKEFIEKNNGEIGVESEDGMGSRFWFTLPINSNLN